MKHKKCRSGGIGRRAGDVYKRQIDALGGLDIPLSYAEMVFMNDYCIETSQETGKSYTPVELPDPKPENEEEILGTYHLNGVPVSYTHLFHSGKSG